MSRTDQTAAILIAEDDDDDYLLTKKAIQDADFQGTLHRVKDGMELMAFLHRNAAERESSGETRMILLLLDLNMPVKDGREALREIKSDPDLRRMPVVVLTTSAAEADIAMAYELGANSFIRKPASFRQFTDFIRAVTKYWFEVAELPFRRSPQSASWTKT